MKSKINYDDNSFELVISLKTWVYILGLIRMDTDKQHSPFFRTLFSSEFSELRQLRDFEPPFRFKHDAIVCLKFKDYVKGK